MDDYTTSSVFLSVASIRPILDNKYYLSALKLRNNKYEIILD